MAEDKILTFDGTDDRDDKLYLEDSENPVFLDDVRTEKDMSAEFARIEQTLNADAPAKEYTMVKIECPVEEVAGADMGDFQFVTKLPNGDLVAKKKTVDPFPIPEEPQFNRQSLGPIPATGTDMLKDVSATGLTAETIPEGIKVKVPDGTEYSLDESNFRTCKGKLCLWMPPAMANGVLIIPK